MKKNRKSYAPETPFIGLFEGCEITEMRITNRKEYEEALEDLSLWIDMKNEAIKDHDKETRKSCQRHIQELKLAIRTYKNNEMCAYKEHTELVLA